MQRDVILLITFSGRTPELAAVVPHFPSKVPLVAMTAHFMPATCPVARHRPDAIILPTPVHEPEEMSFGVSAPTTSTTIAMALGDALAVTVASLVNGQEGRSLREVFRSNHPGGAIGMR